MQRTLQDIQPGQQEQRRHHAEEHAALSAAQTVDEIDHHIQQQAVICQMQREYHAYREQRLGPAEAIVSAAAQHARKDERRHAEQRDSECPRFGGQCAQLLCERKTVRLPGGQHGCHAEHPCEERTNRRIQQQHDAAEKTQTFCHTFPLLLPAVHAVAADVIRRYQLDRHGDLGFVVLAV